MAQFTLQVNGSNYDVDVDPETPLLWVIRDELKLFGTKYGCGIAQCGACTLHIDHLPMRSCCIPIKSIGSKQIMTIEGLSKNGDHPVQEAWIEMDVPQCGYCQSGQIMTAAALIERIANPTDEEINRAMKGNLCRCGTYLRIRKAIRAAAAKNKTI